jgi:hypothetical protein
MNQMSLYKKLKKKFFIIIIIIIIIVVVAFNKVTALHMTSIQFNSLISTLIYHTYFTLIGTIYFK